MMKQSDSKRAKRLLLWGSVGLAVIVGILSFVSVRYTVVASRNGGTLPFSAFPQSNTLTPVKSGGTISDFLKNPRQGAKVVGNRFIASENFPDDKKLAFDILFAQGDSACGYNKIKGLQCGGATSVFRDIKGVCLTTTPIPYDPCCGAAPQIDPRDPDPSCTEPDCTGGPCGCHCAPAPFGCTPTPCPLTSAGVKISKSILRQETDPIVDCTTAPDLDPCCQANPGAIGCIIEVHKECINGQCFAVPGPGLGDPECQGVADGSACQGGSGGDCTTDPDPEACCAADPGAVGCVDDCTTAPDLDACCEKNPDALGCTAGGGGCLPLACNCVCDARTTGDFAWLWDSVTGYCGCNP